MEFTIIAVLIAALWIYFKITNDPENVREACEGKTEEQKQVIRYFLVSSGCGRNTISDAEYDAIVEKTLLDAKKEAMETINLDEKEIAEIEPVHFEKYKFAGAYSKKGNDGKRRSSKLELTWLFFSDSQVFLYTKTKSFDDSREKIATEEFFYKDITSFSTVTDSETIELPNGESMTLESTSFKLVVPGGSLKYAMEENEYTRSAIQGMKAKLREKKR
jgi:hypothetical protein